MSRTLRGGGVDARRNRRATRSSRLKYQKEDFIGWRELGICTASRRIFGGINRHNQDQKSVPPVAGSTRGEITALPAVLA